MEKSLSYSVTQFRNEVKNIAYIIQDSNELTCTTWHMFKQVLYKSQLLVHSFKISFWDPKWNKNDKDALPASEDPVAMHSSGKLLFSIYSHTGISCQTQFV